MSEYKNTDTPNLNRLKEPEAQYASRVETRRGVPRMRETITPIAWNEVEADMLQRYPVLLDDSSQYAKAKAYWGRLNHPRPYTEEEQEARLEQLETRLAESSIQWRTNEDVFCDLERTHTWLR